MHYYYLLVIIIISMWVTFNEFAKCFIQRIGQGTQHQTCTYSNIICSSVLFKSVTQKVEDVTWHVRYIMCNSKSRRCYMTCEIHYFTYCPCSPSPSVLLPVEEAKLKSHAWPWEPRITLTMQCPRELHAGTQHLIATQTHRQGQLLTKWEQTAAANYLAGLWWYTVAKQ